MANITTVVGASGQTFAVTVNGGQTQLLAQQYQTALSTLHTSGGLESYDLVAGSNSATGSNPGHGLISQGGDYSVSGGTTQYISVGSYSESGQDTLNSAVSLDVSGSTASSISVLAGDYAGVTFKAGNQNGTFVGGVGNNTFNGAGSSGNWTVATGDGNDTITGTSGNNTISGGVGNNSIVLGSGTNVVRSEGQDTIDGLTGTDTVTLLGGSSVVTLGSNATVYDTTSHNTVSGGNNSFITGGSSSTYFSTGAMSTVSGGLNDTISASADLWQVRGTSNSITASGSLTFLNGTGATTVSAGTSTLFGASGLDLLLVGGSASSTNLFVGGDGNETVSAASSNGTLHAFAGKGNETIIGGSSADTLVGGSGSATLTGGSGAANLFALTKGAAGGDYTITDFGSAAGNLMALYQYGLQNNNGLANVLSSATVAGGNTTIALSDSSKITFVGVSDLNASNFTLS
ncbi:beta strand repeat-containing protein [Gluconobacter albidus]|uniref:Calcium-binding protein n=1 Tax=Gluconobacter albidus TaxID=318683 RepID=A0AAW3QVT1_9PROT|nr:calcium-binding protein [Gluconobacter albidus]AQS91783.1 hypothetical protein A0U94_13270 [Gluconobacter albidus]KXV37662.1 hypothetical protein AD941_09715 [Gluconobacter albidus]MBS1029326.1 calcium-binding protein [Gluconobacter albidus]MCP1273889.1 calcium-binding protein [Gluconobacter albidus]GLQ70173.1 hypothetical protein GCM10007866_26260 [Gluconobacter albidus]